MAIVSRRSPLRTPVKVVENVFGKKLAPYLVMLAIFVALFGLAAYLAKDKIKEKFTSPARVNDAEAEYATALPTNGVRILGTYQSGDKSIITRFVWTGVKADSFTLTRADMLKEAKHFGVGAKNNKVTKLSDEKSTATILKMKIRDLGFTVTTADKKTMNINKAEQKEWPTNTKTGTLTPVVVIGSMTFTKK